VFSLWAREFIMETTRGGSTRGAVRIAFVQSEWHGAIVDRCRDAFLVEFDGLGVSSDRVDLFRVPGAFEVPLHARYLATSGRDAAVVDAGLWVDSGIYRHEFVAGAVLDGLMRVQLDSGVPVLSAVLTQHHFRDGIERAGFYADHLAVKGAEAARACARTVASLAILPEPAVA
jgi:6,7-dimethyl-8-ribityllumazine synthase